MCLICVELRKNAITSVEARKNLGEMQSVVDEDHRMEVLRRIWDKEDEEINLIGSD